MNKHITEYPSCYAVRFFRISGFEAGKRFYFDEFGSCKAALNAAIDWRDNYLKTRYKHRFSFGGSYTKSKVKSELPVGIYIENSKTKGKARITACWQQHCSDGTRKARSSSKTFTIGNDNEYKAAFDYAVKKRKDMVRANYF